jgi:hypothetical protein
MERISSLLLDTQDFQHPSSLLSLVVGIYLNGIHIGWVFVEEYHTYGAQETPLTRTINTQFTNQNAIR